MNVKESRENKGISQGELARRIGMSQGTLSKIESGARAITPGEAKLISAALSDEGSETATESSVPLPPEKPPEAQQRYIRRAFVCAKDDCLYRRFLSAEEPVPSCPTHSRMVEQTNKPYMVRG